MYALFESLIVLKGLEKGLKRAGSSSIKGLSPSPDLSPFIKGGLKSGFKPSQKGLKSKGLKPCGAWPHAW